MNDAQALAVQVKITKLSPIAVIPHYAHGPQEDAGMDLVASECVTFMPGEVRPVGTGLAIELPPGFEAQIRSRSGLAMKKRVRVANSPGTVDPAYRGEVKVLLENFGSEPFEVRQGDRIAQMIVAPYAGVVWEEVTELEDSIRGQGGFGSTGV